MPPLTSPDLQITKTPNGKAPLCLVDNLRVSFANGARRTRAADGVSMSVFPNQTLAVVGESGSGKSVSAMSILRLIPTPPGRYDGGSIRWQGGQGADDVTDLLTLSERQMREVRGNDIAMIFQEPMTSLNPVYTIGEQIREAVRLHRDVTRAEADDIAAAALRDVGIGDRDSRLAAYPHQSSGGMRQRYMIAMALACQPRLLLADEPTTALDVTIQAQILELLRGLQQSRGMGVMLITHDLGVVAENADTVAVMFAGRVVEFTDVYRLFERPLHPYTRGLLKSMPTLGVAQHASSGTAQRPRLSTVMDAATIPDDFPPGYTVAPHDPTPASRFAAGHRYGGSAAALHEVEPEHWVLCTAADGRAGDAAVPMLSTRRI